MRRVKKSISLALAILMALTLLPANALAVAAADAYTVLCEPNIEGKIGDTYENTAIIYSNYDSATVYETVYNLAEYSNHEAHTVPLPETCVEVSDFTDSGRFVAKIRTQDSSWKYGVIDWRGNVVLETSNASTYRGISDPTQDGYATTWGGNNTLLLNINTGETRPWPSGESFNDGRAKKYVGTNGGYYTYVDINENPVLGEYNNARDFINGYACVSGAGTEYDTIINTAGDTVFTTGGRPYQLVYPYQVGKNGLFVVRDTSSYRYGYADLTGNLVIPCQYSFASMFVNGYAVVRAQDGEGLIDEQGNVIVPFGAYDHLSNASSTGLVWAVNYTMVSVEENGYSWERQNGTIAAVLQVGQAGWPAVEPSAGTADEYIYNTEDPGETLTLPVNQLDLVHDPATAGDAVDYLVNQMTGEQKSAPTCIDLATLYAETAVAKAASMDVVGSEILVDAEAISEAGTVATQAAERVENALTSGGINVARYLSKTVTLCTDETDVSILVSPDVLSSNVDKVRVETPDYALVFKLSDLATDLTQPLTFTARLSGEGTGIVQSLSTMDAENQTIEMSVLANAAFIAVEVGMGGGRTSNSVTICLPVNNGDKTYQTVASADGTATASKYNPATGVMEGKINTSGTYIVKAYQKEFTDIANKSAEMQKAIRYLASKGIIKGTTDTTFSPDGSINRAEIATLLVSALGKQDPTLTASFADVTKGNWFYSAAASSQRHKLITGFEDNTFRGTTNISKVQIVAVSSRVLKTEMGYTEPSSPASYLTKYSDTVASWAQPEVALATKENLVVHRLDGTFSGDKTMTRGDAAIIIYRLFQRIW